MSWRFCLEPGAGEVMAMVTRVGNSVPSPEVYLGGEGAGWGGGGGSQWREGLLSLRPEGERDAVKSTPWRERELRSRHLSAGCVKCYGNVLKLKAEKNSLDMAARGLGIRATISWRKGGGYGGIGANNFSRSLVQHCDDCGRSRERREVSSGWSPRELWTALRGCNPDPETGELRVKIHTPEF